MKMSLIFIVFTIVIFNSSADPLKTLIKKGYSQSRTDTRHCGEDYNSAASTWSISDKDKLLLCVSPDQSDAEANKQKKLQAGRNVLPLMSEFVLISKNKPSSICTNDEVREVDCAAFVSDKKIEVMISHKKMPGLQSVAIIECDEKSDTQLDETSKEEKTLIKTCEKKKGCSSQIPISKDFREHKLKGFLKRIQNDAATLQKHMECLKTNPHCKTPALPQLKDYTLDEQIVLVRLGLKEDNAYAEQVLNWFTLGFNCKEDCISADDFFEDRECRKK